MSNVIDFLERTGQDARLRYPSQTDMEVALAGALIEPEARLAIITGNQSKLESLLGSGVLFSVQFPGKEDEEEGEGDGDGGERDTEESRLAAHGWVNPQSLVHDAFLAV